MSRTPDGLPLPLAAIIMLFRFHESPSETGIINWQRLFLRCRCHNFERNGFYNGAPVFHRGRAVSENLPLFFNQNARIPCSENVTEPRPSEDVRKCSKPFFAANVFNDLPCAKRPENRFPDTSSGSGPEVVARLFHDAYSCYPADRTEFVSYGLQLAFNLRMGGRRVCLKRHVGSTPAQVLGRMKLTIVPTLASQTSGQ